MHSPRKQKLKVLDVFSGIGGFSLGLERAGGFETKAFCEVDTYCQKVLNKHWPNVQVFPDIRSLTHKNIDFKPDLICGGFPCQDISYAGKGQGLKGPRSRLWSEFRRLIEETKPTWVIAENVAALRTRGLGDVLRDLDALGYVGEWHCIPASAAGAPHRRDRIWIIARDVRHADSVRQRVGGVDAGCAAGGGAPAPAGSLHAGDAGGCPDVADTSGARGSPRVPAPGHRQEGHAEVAEYLRDRLDGRPRSSPWAPEPDVGRVADGIPNRVDRLKTLGNAVVPQIPELIGRAIMELENAME